MQFEIPSDIAGELKKLDIADDREACVSLAEFVKRAWHVIEPSTPLVWGRVLDVMCAELEGIFHDPGFQPRLLMNVPPGTMKSILTSVMFPAWIWTIDPSKSFTGAAHEQGLAIRDARKMRIIIESEWYQARWPMAMASDANAKMLFENEFRGFRQAMPFGSLTGRRSDFVICLPYNSLILTDKGNLRIGDIVENRMNVLVAGTNGARLDWQEILEYQKNPGKRSVKIKTANGRSVECTVDHPVYVSGRQWVEAGQVRAGDRVVQISFQGVRELWGSVHHKECGPEDVFEQLSMGTQNEFSTVSEFNPLCDLSNSCLSNTRSQEEEKVPSLLQQRMFLKRERRRKKSDVERRKDEVRLRKLQRSVREARTSAHDPILFSKMQNGTLLGNRHGPFRKNDTNCVPRLQKNVYACRKACENLFEKVRRSFAFGEDSGGSEREIRSRGGREAVPSGLDSVVQGGDSAQRRRPVQTLRFGACESGDTSRTSYQLREGGYFAGEFDHTLQALPREDAWRSEQSELLEETIVESVEHGFISTTYNLNVSPHHTYFVNGILLHNCDDPLSAEDANSKAVLEETRRIFRETLPTRVNNDQSAIIVIMQRLHEEDTSGVIFADPNRFGYKTLILPMRFEPERADPKDWRTTDGELLFPERFSEQRVQADEHILGSYATAGQLQQRPVPREGGMFKLAWFDNRYITSVPDGTRWKRWWDLAATKDKNAARTAGVLLGRTPQGRYIIGHSATCQEEPHRRNEFIKAQCEADVVRFGRNVEFYIPRDPGAGGKETAMALIQHLDGFNVRAIREVGDKESRAEPFSAACEGGNVDILQGDWVKPFLDELTIFPGGKWKDQVDAVVNAHARFVAEPKRNTSFAGYAPKILDIAS